MQTNSNAVLTKTSPPKNPPDRGFTFIDLLVVLIHIGILSSVALPTFLSQATKAKESEARQYVGSMNRAQQAYYLEKNLFATSNNFSDLGLGIPQTTQNYSYTIRGGGASISTVVNAASPVLGSKSPIRAYIGGVTVAARSGTGTVTTLATLCEANTIPLQGGDLGTSNPIFVVSSAPVCPNSKSPAGYHPVK